MYPSGKFGANAAWLRLQVLTHNLLELFKAAGVGGGDPQGRPQPPRGAPLPHGGGGGGWRCWCGDGVGASVAWCGRRGKPLRGSAREPAARLEAVASPGTEK